MKQTITIDVPDGYEAIWKNGKVEFVKLVAIKSQLPKTWEEFCNTYDIKEGEAYINTSSTVCIYENECDYIRKPKSDVNILPCSKAAEQHLALMKLHQLRDCYRQGWRPTEDKVFFGIARRLSGSLYLDRYMSSSRFLTFQSEELARQFLDNFGGLIEQAGDLI